MSVYYLDEALRKLRAVRASLDAIAFASESVLWRGMRDTVVTNPEEFHEQGGTELAAMSTTENKEVALHYLSRLEEGDVALQYADSDRPLLFKFNAKGMSMGVDISYLSVYPLEREVLYPPLTYLMSRGPPEMEGNVTIFSNRFDESYDDNKSGGCRDLSLSVEVVGWVLREGLVSFERVRDWEALECQRHICEIQVHLRSQHHQIVNEGLHTRFHALFTTEIVFAE
ncbi:hypothetical protein T484DRAFT_1915314 [Baffinella frigidus]|nr:hypothetical protein T484DRAFT_1915314 [Cryptophyta sp. CCMP2293]